MRQRVQRLVDAGVIQVVAVTDPTQVGFARQAMIGIRVNGDPSAPLAALEATARGGVPREHGRYVRPARRGRLRGRRPPARPARAPPPAARREPARRRSSTSSCTGSATTGAPGDAAVPAPTYATRRSQGARHDQHPAGGRPGVGRHDHTARHRPRPRRPPPPVEALHPRVGVRRGPRGADHRARRGRVHLRRPRSALPRRARRAVRGPGRPRSARAGRGGRQAGRATSRSSRCGRTRTPRPSTSPSGSRTSRPAT